MPRGQRRPPRQPARADGNRAHTVYSVRLALQICVRLAEGERWTFICNTGALPACSTLYNWQGKHPAFAEALAQARELARERGGRLDPQDIHHLKGLLMTETPRRRTGGGTGSLRPIKNGKIVHVRYGAEIARKICERLAAGEVWSRMAGKGEMPSYWMLAYWKKKHPEFAAAVEEAKRIGAEAKFDQALEVALDTTPETLNTDKVRIATLVLHAERLDPERFGKSAGARGSGDDERIRRITIRRFERAWREDGTEYVRVIESEQDVEDGR